MIKINTTKGIKSLALRIPSEVWNKVKTQAEKEDKSRSFFIYEAIEAQLKRKEKHE